jgi:hypothetical protein
VMELQQPHHARRPPLSPGQQNPKPRNHLRLKLMAFGSGR